LKLAAKQIDLGLADDDAALVTAALRDVSV
jgi:hypothetical protein